MNFGNETKQYEIFFWDKRLEKYVNVNHKDFSVALMITVTEILKDQNIPNQV